MAGTAVADDPCWQLVHQVIPYVRCSAEHGSDVMQVHLGLRYLFGRDVPQDYEEAAKWFRRAADQGQDVAQHSLGEMYAIGQGMQLDFVQAHMWFNLAAAQGYKEAEEARWTIERQMTPAQVLQAQKMAREWKPKPER
jgi:TPR repeat protein